MPPQYPFATVTDNCIRFSGKAADLYQLFNLDHVSIWATKAGIRIVTEQEGVASYPLAKINDQYTIASRKAVAFVRAASGITGTRRFNVSGEVNNLLLTLDETYI